MFKQLLNVQSIENDGHHIIKYNLADLYQIRNRSKSFAKTYIEIYLFSLYEYVLTLTL